ncbi:sodium:solute symporter [Flavobacterium sp. CBA20B-1]|uniref:sodium:solute symporter n=1 Tax=unclassified Flavobacterium TaxID=196869 RepID=UPI0022250DDE|nr:MULTISPECIES: sodium:solute symporter [unclassified Flavobacterium]WCM42322.1 sodium:solute symporter [Flavobacterium sp. CBA20B-1]
MELLDWIILLSTLLFIVLYGTYRTKGSKNIQEYILANQSTNWFTVGLSVMATQASAITFLSTPGQAYHDGMGFVQFYFGLPLAMVVICMVFIPVFHRLKVYTAYEFLETRFDLKTRTLASVIFLVQRSIGTGITIYAPAIILSSILNWDLTFIIVSIGIVIIFYTYFGGTKALNITQKQQAFVIMAGMFLTFFIILFRLPEEVTFVNVFNVAKIEDKLNLLNFSTDFSETYTLWNGLTAGFFLMLAYFGTDQSQVGRYLSGKSIKETQVGLLMNGVLKVPMQFFILLVGVMVFIFFHFYQAPLHFNPVNTEKVLNSEYQEAYRDLEIELKGLLNEKKEITQIYTGQLNQGYENEMLEEKLVALNENEVQLRQEARDMIKKVDSGAETNDKDYVFIYFILNYLPHGIIGFLLAMIFSAAMSSSASGLYAVASSSAIDIYKTYKPNLSEQHYLKVTKYLVVFWGIICILAACVITLFENLIQLVNIIGSIFYGTVLGIFLIAFFIKYIKAKATFWGALLAQILVIYIYSLEVVSYLWLNPIGVFSVILIGLVLQMVFSRNKNAQTTHVNK